MPGAISEVADQMVSHFAEVLAERDGSRRVITKGASSVMATVCSEWAGA